MRDIVITVPILSVFKEVARRTAVATETDPFYDKKTTEDKQYSQLHGEGDRITSDFTKEAAKEVLKAYLSRQGDVIGTAFEYGNTAVAAVKQKETVTLFGGSGDATIAGAGDLTVMFSCAYPTSLTKVASDFVTANAEVYLAELIVVTSLENTIIFESAVAGVPFTAPTIETNSGNLGGVVTHTTANVVASNTGNIVYRFAENPVPLSISQTNAIIERLTNNTKDAIIYYVMVSLYRTDGNKNKEAECLAKALQLIDELSGDLYRLHD